MRKFILMGAAALIFPTIATAKPKPQPMLARSVPAAEATPAAPDKKIEIARKIKADWPKYDAGAKGCLSPDELAKWLSDLRVAASQPVPDAEWQKSALIQTDTNNDAKVSVEELTAFLTAGA